MMFSRLVCLGFVATVSAEVLFQETFGKDWEKRWITSSHKDDYGKVDVTAGEFYNDKDADAGLHTAEDAKNYAVSAKFDKSFSNEGKTLAIQFSVKHEQGIDCGGGYFKFAPAFEQKDFHGGEGETEYNIMFGPDVCGHTKKVHLIFNYKGKNLIWKKEPRVDTDKFTHLYTLILNADNTYEVKVDNEKKESGNLQDDWDFLEPKEIPDPEDKKPEDWVDEAEMDDPEDKKPEGHDDIPATIVDPEAKQPEEWDEEEDGEWEAPKIANPDYKGEWKAKRIPNPKYKGSWKAKDIPNPAYVADDKLYLYKDFSGVGLDVWQVKAGSIFDNLIVATDAADVSGDAWEKQKTGEKAASDKHDEEEKKKKEEEDAKKKAEEDEKDEKDDEEGDEDL